MSLKEAYTGGARAIASRSMTGLARTRLTPNMLTAAGVTLCALGAVLVYFEYRTEWFFFFGGLAFVVGSVLDILDGALARAGGKQTPFGGFLDSTLDRVGEGLMLGAIALVFMRDGKELALAPWGVLPWAIGLLALTAWITVLQRILHVRRELSTR